MRRVLLVVLLAASLEALASLLLCMGTTLSFSGGFAIWTFPFIQWIESWRWFKTSWWIDVWIVFSAILPAIIGFGAAGFIVRRGSARPQLNNRAWFGLRKEKEGTTANHGRARFATKPEARAALPGGSEYGGLAVVALRKFGPPLIDNRQLSGLSGHSMDISGSGAGKTRRTIMDMFTWIGNAVVLDPKCRIGPVTRKALEDDGYRVIILDPKIGGAGFNALDWIDTENDPLAEQHVRTVVSWIFKDDPKDLSGNAGFFLGCAKELCECILCELLWNPDAPANLWEMRQAISRPSDELMQILTVIRNNSLSVRARELAGSFMVGKALEMFESICRTASENTSWLSIRAYAQLVSGDTFKTSDIHGKERLRVFLQVPLSALLTSPGIARVTIGSMMNSMIEAGGRSYQKQVLFLLDEAMTLGAMKTLETARAQGREYGISMHMIYQSMWDIARVWTREGLDAWLDGVDWRMYSAVRARHTAEEISKEMGKRGVLARSEGNNVSRANANGRAFGWQNSSNIQVNEHEIGRDLMFADEIMRMKNDEVLVLFPGHFPIRGYRPLWHDYPAIAAMVDKDEYAKLDEVESNAEPLLAEGGGEGPADPAATAAVSRRSNGDPVAQAAASA